MRGNPTLHKRSGTKPRPRDEANGTPYMLPAPYGGWNARGNLATMDPTDAILMDNCFPDVQNIRLRKGYVNWTTGFAADVKMLMPYNSSTTSKLFAATDTAIYDASSSGAVGASVTTNTNGRWSYVNFRTAGGSFLILANGTDAVKSYDGAVWANPAITVATPANLIYVTAHQKRLFFVEKNSMNIWYLPTSSIAGAAVQFPVGELFKEGGKIVAIGSWTFDGGNGSNDLFVIVTSKGEIAVYQGTDPASSSTWGLVGVYAVPLPLGDRPLLDYGGDLLYLSRSGLFPISKLAQSILVERNRQISYKIDAAFLEVSDFYSANTGWQMFFHKTLNLLSVNIPVSNTISYQFVMNTITKAWCRFTGWNASCWAEYDGNLYFATGTKTCKAWTGTSDNGTPIQATIIQAYSRLGIAQQKYVTMARPNIQISGTVQLAVSIDTDFQTFSAKTNLSYTSALNSAVWDSGIWDTAVWDNSIVAMQSIWYTIPSMIGNLHSFRLQLTTSSSTFEWTSTDVIYRPAGLI